MAIEITQSVRFYRFLRSALATFPLLLRFPFTERERKEDREKKKTKKTDLQLSQRFMSLGHQISCRRRLRLQTFNLHSLQYNRSSQSIFIHTYIDWISRQYKLSFIFTSLHNRSSQSIFIHKYGLNLHKINFLSYIVIDHNNQVFFLDTTKKI
jgi:hypothetical protein